MRREVSLRSRHPRRGLVSRALGLLLAMAMFATPGSSARAGGGFEHGFPPGDDFFPLAVWLQAPFRAPEYVAIGTAISGRIMPPRGLPSPSTDGKNRG